MWREQSWNIYFEHGSSLPSCPCTREMSLVDLKWKSLDPSNWNSIENILFILLFLCCVSLRLSVPGGEQRDWFLYDKWGLIRRQHCYFILLWHSSTMVMGRKHVILKKDKAFPLTLWSCSSLLMRWTFVWSTWLKKVFFLLPGWMQTSWFFSRTSEYPRRMNIFQKIL